MKDMLQNKVSTLMAQKEELEKEIVSLNVSIETKDQAALDLNAVIARLEAKIDDHLLEITELQNMNDDLKIKGGELSPVMFDKL